MAVSLLCFNILLPSAINFLIFGLMIVNALILNFLIIHGWSMYEVMLLYSVNMFSYGFAATFFFFQMRDVERMVYEGTFDGMLVKPINPFIHMIIRTFGHFFLGDIVVAVIMFFVCFQALNITLGFFTLIFLILMMVGAILIHAAFIVLTGSPSFWFIRSTSATNMVLNGIRGFANCPISIYHS